MQSFARFAKTAGQKAVPVVVAGAASSSVALADAPRDEVLQSSRLRIQDAWELAELDKDTVLFKPAEIDDAISELCRRPQSAAIEDVDSSDISSDSGVDAILEYGVHTAFTGGNSAVGLPLSMQELMTVASRMLKSPGLQREMIIAALSDPEVFNILDSKVDLPQYLEATGFAAKGLLSAPEAASSCTTLQELASSSADSPADSNPLVRLSAKVAEGVEHVGNAVAHLGRWMRVRITGQQAADAAKELSEGASSGSAAGARRVDSVLGAVMVVCVAVIAVVVLRRPAALKDILKRVRIVRRA